ncbi:MAG: response regulator [Alphaproteobacteria bacterium]
MMPNYSACIVDSRKLFRGGLKNLLADTPFRIVCEADTVEEVGVAINGRANLDLVLLDLTPNPELVALQIGQLKAFVPRSRVVVLTNDECPTRVAASIDADADGYLVKDISCEMLVEALTRVMQGERVFPRFVNGNGDGSPDCPPEPLEDEGRAGLEAHGVEGLSVELLDVVRDLNRRRPPTDKHGRDEFDRRNRALARDLCRELGHLAAVRMCKKNGWSDLHQAIQANRAEALDLGRRLVMDVGTASALPA